MRLQIQVVIMKSITVREWLFVGLVLVFVYLFAYYAFIDDSEPNYTNPHLYDPNQENDPRK